MKRLLFFFSLLVPLFAFSQGNDTVYINVSADAVFCSNSLNYNMINKYFKGGKIDNELKDKWSRHIKDDNRLFTDDAVEISALWRLQGKRYAIGLSYQLRFFGEARFTETLWNTAFYGNKQYGTDKVDFGFNAFRYTAYRDLKLEFATPEWKLNDKSRLHLTLAGGFRVGIGDIDFVASELTMQNMTGLFEQINIQGAFDLQNSSSQYINGIGGAFDLGLHFVGEFAERNLWQFHLFTKNLGFIRWKSNSLALSKNLDFSFEGLEMNLSKVSGGFRGVVDSLIGFVADSAGRGPYLSASPASLHASTEILFYNYHPLIVGVSGAVVSTLFSRFVMMASVAPSVGKEWKTANSKRRFIFSLPVSYCNYSGFGVGGAIDFLYIPVDDMKFAFSIAGGVRGFTSAAPYGALKLLFEIQ